MKEILLLKYGEVVLKGANKSVFENAMVRDIKRKVADCGNFSVSRCQSTVFVEPLDDFADIDGALEACKKVFGIVSICRAAVCDKDMDSILKTVKEYIPEYLTGCRTFKADAKRSDKKFPLKSPQIAAEVGGAVLSAAGGIRVDVKNPDIVVMVEIRETSAYVHAGKIRGAGGMPQGSSGRGLLLLSGGIDSPVAGYMMAKRGVEIEALHFESFPYTSERAREKVFELARILSGYTSGIKVHVISLTKIQEELKNNCEEDYFTLLLRRFMMHLAQRVAELYNCKAIITGESLAQVASQTMQAIAVTDAAVDMPVFRPAIGLDKEEIIRIAREIGTFETSILPFEDCCTVFTPRHPRTKPELEKVMAQENRVDFATLADEAFQSMYTVEIKP
ncbi:MAG: tRNA 4-thiouridine(8) synthase ThiI [Ruminococcaceae bacterium]|nr:tRNA 4-thiouridine(8) synthase ThiI [Oscillospiraceae bacterium]